MSRTLAGHCPQRAVASLVLEPPGLSHSFFARDGVMTQRFVVRHNRDQDGTLSVARRLPRRGVPFANPGEVVTRLILSAVEGTSRSRP